MLGAGKSPTHSLIKIYQGSAYTVKHRLMENLLHFSSYLLLTSLALQVKQGDLNLR